MSSRSATAVRGRPHARGVQPDTKRLVSAGSRLVRAERKNSSAGSLWSSVAHEVVGELHPALSENKESKMCSNNIKFISWVLMTCLLLLAVGTETNASWKDGQTLTITTATNCDTSKGTCMLNVKGVLMPLSCEAVSFLPSSSYLSQNG